jgi:hypothetical protein
MRLRIGGLIAVPWDWTDLPVPQVEEGSSSDCALIVLLSPSALRDIVRFVRGRCNQPRDKKHSNV